jgi:hypothetical protein
MSSRLSILSILLLLVSVVLLISRFSQSGSMKSAAILTKTSLTPLKGGGTEFFHEAFDKLLRKYVVNGKVNYRNWVNNFQDRTALLNYIKEIGEARPDRFPKAEQKAFWINAYNALTLASVLEKYPLKSVNYDFSHEEKAKGFWDRPYPVGGAEYSLNQIENVILRPHFSDPRIHFAINCASLGCPPLQPRAFDASDLDTLLEDATRDFLNDRTKGVVWNSKSRKLALSPIFQWYAEDFGAIPDFIARYRPDIRDFNGKIAFLMYDWSLNDVTNRSFVQKLGRENHKDTKDKKRAEKIFVSFVSSWLSLPD